MSGFYGKHMNGGSQFIKHPSAVANKQSMRYAYTNSKEEDVPANQQFPIMNGDFDENKIDKDEVKINESKTLLVTKQSRSNQFERYHEKLLRKNKRIKKKANDKLCIEKIQNKIDVLSEAFKKCEKVSTEDHQQLLDDPKIGNKEEKKEFKINKKETMHALLLIAGIVLYTFTLILLSDEHDSSPNAIKFQLSKSTPRKSLIDYLFNISSK